MKLPLLTAAVLAVVLSALPGFAFAEQGDCGQPSSTGEQVKTSDAQTILKEAVGQPTACDAKPCICDTDGNGNITTADGLRTLKKAVGQPVTLTCDCPVYEVPCTAAEITLLDGSQFDFGWTGLGHGIEPVRGSVTTLHILRKCSTSQSACKDDEDCPAEGTCVATCDCATDTTCEIAGPFEKKCFNSLDDCTTNADCGELNPCLTIAGPPQPFVTNGSSLFGPGPLCAVTFFDSALTGTLDAATGELALAATLRSRLFTGTVPTTGDEAAGGPCPVCGRVTQSPEVGDVFTCDGGQRAGEACTVEGVSDVYGGTSSDCPPVLGGNLSSSGLVIGISQLTTGTLSRTAQLPCKAIGFTGNPLNPESNPKCLDDGTACTSNADCKRCTGDNSTPCTNNGSCAGNGTCAEAPDQPITCGFWCSCGSCSESPNLPCFESSDCSDEQTCEAGTGAVSDPDSPQTKPNNCSGDKFICGEDGTERCATTLDGRCSLKPWLPLCDTNTDCSAVDGGTCVLEQRRCYEPRITRSGDSTAIGSYCSIDGAACTSNADCTGGGNACTADSSVVRLTAAFCIPASQSGTLNASFGLPGPGTIDLRTLVKICRCGDSILGCDETCDDGNTASGDGCDSLCGDD